MRKSAIIISILSVLIRHELKAQFFEGIITYRFEVQNNGFIPDSIFKMMFEDSDTEEKLFFRNGNYKTITNLGKSVTLLNSAEKGMVYCYIDDGSKPATALRYDGTNLNEGKFEFIAGHEVDTILGIPCTEVIYKIESNKGYKSEWHFYYSNQIIIDSTKFKSCTKGDFAMFFKKYGSIPLKITTTGTGCLHTICLTAINIDKSAVNPKTFKVPHFKEYIDFPI